MNLPVSLKTTANVLGLLLLIAVVAPFVVYAIPGVVGAEHGFVVLTASMTPAIAPGDVVIVDERDPTAIAEGDVITFVRGNNEVPVTHRVIDVVATDGGPAFETKGDANEGPDASLVAGTNVIGVVAVTIPYIGYVIQFAGSPLGFAALVVVPFGLLVLSELWVFVRDRDGAGTVGAAGASDDGTTPTDEFVFDDPEVSAAADGAESAPTEGPAMSAAGGHEPAQGDGTELSLDTVTGAGAVLAAFTPYSVYVAFQIRTALAVSVAIATSALLVGAVGVWLSGTGVLDRDASAQGDGRSPNDRTDNAVLDPVDVASDEKSIATDGSGSEDR
ncbi:signal peptidase I [Halorubrum halophilum]|uniref:signal peptidase I n=1 Tax=Halorubrum halophilum TaxID=413816 RepID=UPI000678E7E1|nr:signal peptidase I [Halorubrum halophilum]